MIFFYDLLIKILTIVRLTTLFFGKLSYHIIKIVQIVEDHKVILNLFL